MALLDPLTTWDGDEIPEEEMRIPITRGTAGFASATLTALVALAIFVVSTTVEPAATEYLLREISFTLAALSLPIALASIIATLPTNRRASVASLVAIVIAIVFVVYFVQHYPHNWNVVNDTNTSLVGMLLYSASILPLALLTFASLCLYLVERAGLMMLPPEARHDPSISREQVRQHVRRLASGDAGYSGPGPHPGETRDETDQWD